MPNEATNQASALQPTPDASQVQTPEEPVDIAAAFQLLREGNKAPAQPAGQEDQSNQSNETSDDSGEQGVDGSQESGVQMQPDVPVEPTNSEGTGDLGGSTTTEPAVDYSATQQSIINGVTKESQRIVNKIFEDQGIREYSVSQLYERKDSGEVIFNNPERPNQPFASRAEAQAWCDAINRDIEFEKRKMVEQKQRELFQQAMPALRLIEFAPTYDAMDSVTKSVFDNIIEPYGVKNTAGEVVGFNCNLNAMAQQAAKIVQQFAPQQAQPQQTQQASTDEPAMDLKGGASESNQNTEPTNIQEAWQMLNKNKKKG